MPRCRSWFPAQQDRHPVLHRPGRCRTCWRPCHNQVPSGMQRCSDCSDTLATHPSPRVRRSLAEQSDDLDVLQFLTSDLAGDVAAAARQRVRHLADTRLR